LINESLLKRREWLKDAVRHDTPYRISEMVEDGNALFEAAKEHELEGIIAKVANSKYLPGKRSDYWLKIKVRQTAEVLIVGYTEGKGNRQQTFGALHIAEKNNGALVYRGKVGTGFDDSTMKDVAKQIKRLDEIKKPFKEKVLDEKVSTWVDPSLFIEVAFSKLTPDKMFREPVFIRMRPDI
jgi:ATP-dependent DNA ligase